jgi:hypothetical protein
MIATKQSTTVYGLHISIVCQISFYGLGIYSEWSFDISYAHASYIFMCISW